MGKERKERCPNKSGWEKGGGKNIFIRRGNKIHHGSLLGYIGKTLLWFKVDTLLKKLSYSIFSFP